GVIGARPYLAMELVQGRTLRAWLDERQRSWREIVAVYRQAGDGLRAGHRAGLVHGDFKPDNVLLRDDERAPATGFGLARAGGERASGGTPAYMAPEQIGGAADARADIYSFCVALDEALGRARAVPPRLLRTLQRGRSPRPEERHPNIDALLADLGR